MAQLVRAPPCHGGGRRFEPDLGRLCRKLCLRSLTKSKTGALAGMSRDSHVKERGLSSAGRASALQAEGHRFEPYRPHFLLKHGMKCADMAQLAEQLICNQQVIGSSPIIGFVEIPYGWVPEWPKGTDCKSAANCFGGSNPPPSIFFRINSLKKHIIK